MPYILTKTNVKLSRETEVELKAALGEAIGLIRGKTERWLMCDFEDNCRLWFAGNDEKCAYCEIKLLGAAQPDEYDALTAKMCEILSSALKVPTDRIYIKYEEISHWGFNGTNF